MRCFKCKKEISDDLLRCNFCNTKLKTVCPICGAQNLITKEYCDGCGLQLLKYCPECNAVNLPNSHNCRKCSNVLEHDSSLVSISDIGDIEKTVDVSSQVSSELQNIEQKTIEENVEDVNSAILNGQRNIRNILVSFKKKF